MLEKEKFLTTWRSIFFNPYFFVRRGLHFKIKSYSVSIKGILLDFGCGQKPYENLFNCTQYIGLDIKTSGHSHKKSKVDVFYDGNHIPFEDQYFDSIFSSEVLTHVFNTPEILKELNRVLKPGGVILITVPFSWFENEIPYDNNRFTSFGINYSLEQAGFNIIKTEKTTNFIQTIFQLINAYVFHNIGVNKFLQLLTIILIIAPFNFLGLVLSLILPKDNSLYCNNIVLAKKSN